MPEVFEAVVVPDPATQNHWHYSQAPERDWDCESTEEWVQARQRDGATVTEAHDLDGLVSYQTHPHYGKGTPYRVLDAYDNETCYLVWQVGEEQ